MTLLRAGAGVTEYLGASRLVREIPARLQIEGLKPALMHLLHDQTSTLEVNESCRRILLHDWLRLMRRCISARQRPVSTVHTCTSRPCTCRSTNEGAATDSARMCSTCGRGLCGRESQSLELFGCGHAFHSACLMHKSPSGEFKCSICSIHPDAPSNSFTRAGSTT